MWRTLPACSPSSRTARLDAWIDGVDGVDGDTLPALASFARHLRKDHDAVVAGLTLPHSSGPVEGTVNRIKMLKRQIYGRANFDLLRKRVLIRQAGDQAVT